MVEEAYALSCFEEFTANFSSSSIGNPMGEMGFKT